jgi:hypothetical protein
MEIGENKMSNRIRVKVLGTLVAILALQAQATPVDVNGDGKVGPQEVIDLSQNWKGPASLQPWEINGANIGYNLGSVGIGTSAPDVKFQVNDGRIRIRESATLERWDFFYDPPSEQFYIQENAGFNHIVFTKGPDSRVGIGTDAPAAGTKLNVVTNAPYNTAILGEGTLGLWGIGSGASGVGILATGGDYAGDFYGNVHVHGTVIELKSTITIDHPLDPANKYLQHSSVESSDMKNIYDGNVVLNDKGEAEVELPDWFETLNKDFRYQLTPIGAPGANLHIAQKITDSRFRISGGSAKLEVSWQVTGIRQDAWAKANPIEVEKLKSDGERGKYLTPEVYGQAKEMGIGYRVPPRTEISLGAVSKGE